MIGQIVNVFHKMKACVKEVLSYLEGQDFLSIDQIDLDISKFWEVQLGLFGILNLATLILANSPAKTFTFSCSHFSPFYERISYTNYVFSSKSHLNL